MTRTDNALAALAQEEVFAWAAHAEAMSFRMEELLLGNAQGGQADFDDYEVRQRMAEGF
jgi:hypothetical protein